MNEHAHRTTLHVFEDCWRKNWLPTGAFDSFVRSVIPDFSAVENEDRGKDGKQLMVTFKRPDSEESLTVEFDALSDGEKCYFLVPSVR